MINLPPLPEQQLLSAGGTICGEDIPVYGHDDDALLGYANVAVREALEQAAQVCDSVDNHSNPMTATDCAELIRALKDNYEN